MKIGDIVVRKSYDKDIIFRIIDIKEVRGKVYCILKGLSIRIIADSPKDDLEVVDYVYVEEKEKILNNRVNEAMKKAKGIQRKIGMREQINCRSNKNEFLSHAAIPVFRRSTMKVPTFSILPMHFRLLKYLKRLDFTGKFNVLTGHFFIENFFGMLYNSSTT